MNIEPNTIGAIDKATITEHLCVTKIKKLGFGAHIAHVKAADIVMDVNGMLLRVQVKSSRLKTHMEGAKRKCGYHFSIAHGSKVKTPITSNDCDIIALVAFERERIYFLHIDHHNQSAITKRLPKRFFDDPEDNMSIERDSLLTALKKHKERYDG